MLTKFKRKIKSLSHILWLILLIIIIVFVTNLQQTNKNSQYKSLKKIHVLVIPKGEYVDLNDFNNNASDKEIVEFNKAITHVSNLLGVKEKGYRTLTNIGNDGGQEVPHLHFHIFAGENIGKMVS